MKSQGRRPLPPQNSGAEGVKVARPYPPAICPIGRRAPRRAAPSQNGDYNEPTHNPEAGAYGC